MFLRIFLTIAFFSVSSLAASPTAWNGIDHVIVVVLENTKADDALKQPFQKELAASGAFLSNYYAVAHPSEPNYIAMIAGNTFGVHNDANVDLPGQNVSDLLDAAGKSWRVYAEDYPGNCNLNSRVGLYARKHVPFMSFTSIQKDSAKCAKIVPGAQFAKDLAKNSLPNFSYFVPNMNDDGHDTSPAFADAWLKKTFGALFKNKKKSAGTLLIVTYDEDDSFADNRVYTVFVGDSVAPGTVSTTKYTHYSLLRTIEDIFKLGSLQQKDLSATPILDIWHQ